MFKKGDAAIPLRAYFAATQTSLQKKTAKGYLYE